MNKLNASARLTILDTMAMLHTPIPKDYEDSTPEAFVKETLRRKFTKNDILDTISECCRFLKHHCDLKITTHYTYVKIVLVRLEEAPDLVQLAFFLTTDTDTIDEVYSYYPIMVADPFELLKHLSS